MASLNMAGGSYPLTTQEIDRHVTRKSAGNYALGLDNAQGRFSVNYVGRSPT